MGIVGNHGPGRRLAGSGWWHVAKILDQGKQRRRGRLAQAGGPCVPHPSPQDSIAQLAIWCATGWRARANDGGNACFVRADVARAEDVAALVAACVARYGRLDCAVNNAGISARGELTHELAEEDWSRVLAINLTGVWLSLKYEIAQMLEQGGGGAIFNEASVTALVGGVTSVYVASKHGVVGLTKQAALEYALLGIRINAVCPGAIRTPLVDRVLAARSGLEERWRAAEPIGRFGTAEEVAAAVVWLCSDAASFVTGVALPVDGGWLTQ